MTISEVGIVGCGIMGAGIAQICATHGYRVCVTEEDPDRLEEGLATIRRRLNREVDRGRLSRERHDRTLRRLRGRPLAGRPCQQRPCDRSRGRRFAHQEGPLRVAGRSLQGGCDPREQHLIAFAQRNGRLFPPPRAGDRHPLLQPAHGAAAGGSDLLDEHLAGDDRHGHGLLRLDRPADGAREGFARLHREPPARPLHLRRHPDGGSGHRNRRRRRPGVQGGAQSRPRAAGGQPT